jgi:ATP-dependent exoDNAse (exonuclease V) beta subunit
MSELRRADQRARERALDVTGSFIVQAPAGSGKTELLVRRFLALLATVDDPESVLAITFTRKAAAEMRNRIVRALRAAAEPGADRADLHARTLELARSALAVDRRLGWDLLGNPGRLRIQTIDSLNLGLARRLPVLSGLGAGLGIEEDAHELYRAAAERLLTHLPSDEALHAQAVATLLEHFDNRVPRFIALVVEMLQRRESWGPLLPAIDEDPAAVEASRAGLESARAGLVGTHLAALRRAFPEDLLQDAVDVAREAAAGLVAGDSDSPITAWAGRHEPPGDVPEEARGWLGLAALLLTEKGTPRRKFDLRLGMPPGPAGKPLRERAADVAARLERHEEATLRLDEVRTLPPAAYDPREWQVLQAQLVVLRLAVAELEIVFAERRAADYPRFAFAARQALGSDETPTDTALALDATLRHVLVDEFQDTSEAQVDLLERLTAGWQPRDGRTLFLVGDPMQSIYRFRNAEVGLFLTVRDHGLGALELEPLTLSVNFRSTEPVIDWVNATFARVLPGRDDVLQGAVSYAPGACAPDAGRDGGVVVHALFRRSRIFEATTVADIVQDRLGESPSARIAILVQARSHLIHIVAELGRRGVAFQATDIDPLGERPTVLDLLALTRALAHAADRPAWLAVLRAPWCSLGLEDLHALVGDDLEATVAELLRDTTRRARLAPEPRARLECAWGVLQGAAGEVRRFGLRDAVERAWLALGGPATAERERDLAEAQAYFDELARLEERGAGFVDLARLADALEELYAPSAAAAGVRVELLTIHKAKGLQFDTVIVPGLDSRTRDDYPRLLHWARIPGADRHELVIAPVAGAGADANPLYAWLAGLEKAKLLQEKRRLLYVAATRAERWLHLFGACRLKESDGATEIVRPASSVALGMLWPAVERHFARRLEELGNVEGETPPEPDREPRLRRFRSAWRLPAIQTPRIEVASSTRAAPPALVEFDWATETARHVGTVVHRELQRLARAGPTESAFDGSARRRHHVELAELGVPAERRAAAVERVATALQRTLDDPRGRWLLDPQHAAAENELALTGWVGGELASIVIDRTFVDAAGTRWIVDYKTSSHEGADLEGFLDREQERYRPQLQRYAELMGRLGPEPIRLGLYFPLLSAWREWA